MDDLNSKEEKGSKKSFSFKIKTVGNSKKTPKKIIAHINNEQLEKDYITEVKDQSIQSLKPKHDKGPLVIPLSTNNWSGQEKGVAKQKKNVSDSANETIKEQEKTLDEKAAEELIREIRNEKGIQKSSEKLFMTDKIIKVDDQQYKDKEAKNVPVLIANAIPGLKDIDDENERFQKDVDMRADDMDFKSAAYQAVPIEEFGAALLRGMGWEGPKEEEGSTAEEQMAPRHFRLGLGAAPKPVEEPQGRNNRGGRRRKPGEKKVDTNKEWRKMAKEKVQSQQLRRGAIVLITSHKETDLVGKRGKILKTQESVPGLDNLLVSMERSGEEVVAKKQSLLLISEAELEEKPFKFSKPKETPEESTNGFHHRYRSASSSSEETGTSKDKKSHKKKKKKKDKKEKSRKRSRSREKKLDTKKSRKDQSKQTQNEELPGPPPGWLVEGIRVRVVSEKVASGKYFRKKGVVVEVPVLGKADVKMDGGPRLEGVRERYLETALPSTGGKVIILQGERKYAKGKILEKNMEKEQASIHLSDEMEIVTISFDDIAEYVGRIR